MKVDLIIYVRPEGCTKVETVLWTITDHVALTDVPMRECIGTEVMKEIAEAVEKIVGK